jgi:HlyD family secretion protein
VNAVTKRIVVWSIPALVLAVVLVLAFRPQPQLVDLVTVASGPLVVTVDEEGESRVRDIYSVAAPVAGRMLRIPLRVGDSVKAGETEIASIEPADPAFLDPRAQAQSAAAVAAAEAALEFAGAEAQRADAERDFAAGEVQRSRRLFATGTVPERAIDNAERAHLAAEATLEAANASLEVRSHELVQARAAFITPSTPHTGHNLCDCVTLTAPVDGHVLAIHQKSETVVAPGTLLIDIGDPADLEVVVDLLSSDAVKVRAGQRAVITNWGGDQRLDARVRRVEPVGFTKVSALGIEEQRVNVVLDLTAPREQWATLGHGYRVEVGVVIWETDAAVSVPVTALFRDGEQQAVFVDLDGRATVRPVAVGPRSGLQAVIETGLAAGERIVLHPQAHLEPGDRIESR